MSTMQPASPALTGLLLAAQAEPEGDDTSRLVLADFLADHDDPRAEMVRLSTALARYHPGDPEWHDLSERLDEWQKRHLADWLGKQGKVSLHRGLVRLEVGDAILSGRTLASRLRTALEEGWVESLTTSFTGQSLERAISLGRLACVTALELDGVSGADWKHLGDLAHLRALSLNDRFSKWTDASIAFLANLPRLERLVLIASKNLSATGLQQLSSAGRLRELELNCTTDLTEEHLCVVARLSKLRKLVLRTSWPLPSAVVQLAPLQDLHCLSLGNCSRLGPEELSQLAVLPRLQQLSLFGDPLASDLRPLTALPNLHELELAGCRSLSGETLAQLAEFTGLERLGLTQSVVTSEGLAALLCLKGLRWLNLVGSSGFSGAGLAYLAKLPELRRLDLDLAAWRTGAVKEHLSGLRQLRQLHLAWQYIPKSMIEPLARALPQCRITVEGIVSPY